MTNYTFDLISKSGDSVSIGGGTTNLIGELGNYPSINDFGSVAFIGKFGTGFSAPTDLLVSNPLGNIINLSDQDFGKFGNQVQINNNNQVISRDSSGGSQAIRVWDAGVSNSYSVEATGGLYANLYDFSFLYPFQRINDNGQSVFVGNTSFGFSQNQVLATQKGQTRDYNKIDVASANIKPSIANNGNIVFREHNSDSIRLTDYQLNLLGTIASNNSGFSSVGVGTSISDDGKVVAFYGDLDNPGATPATEGLEAGEGIFISIEKDSGREIKRIAGISGNNILDPGETYVDLNENGQFDSGTETDVGLSANFNTDESLGVSFTETDNGGFGTIAYLASDQNDSESLISSKYNISFDDETESIQTNVTSELVAKVGEPANEIKSDLTGDIQDLNIYCSDLKL
ncbi:MAG: hypothetical protein AAGE84_22990 [Cyanobacteria bacterium P01_G01_bin.39]